CVKSLWLTFIFSFRNDAGHWPRRRILYDCPSPDKSLDYEFRNPSRIRHWIVRHGVAHAEISQQGFAIAAEKLPLQRRQLFHAPRVTTLFKWRQQPRIDNAANQFITQQIRGKTQDIRIVMSARDLGRKF